MDATSFFKARQAFALNTFEVFNKIQLELCLNSFHRLPLSAQTKVWTFKGKTDYLRRISRHIKAKSLVVTLGFAVSSTDQIKKEHVLQLGLEHLTAPKVNLLIQASSQAGSFTEGTVQVSDYSG